MSQPVAATPVAPARSWLYGFCRGALMSAGGLLFGLCTLLGARAHTGLGPVVDFLLGVLIGVLVLGVPSLLIRLATLLIRRIRRVPPGPPGIGGLIFGAISAGGGCFGVLTEYGGAPLTVGWPYFVVVVLAVLLLGAAVGTVWQHGGKRGPAWFLSVMVVLNLAMFAGLFYQPGYAAGPPGWPGPAAIAQSTAPNPSLKGPYRVATLTYGSGDDKLRREYRSAVTLQTARVDITPITPGITGFYGRVRDWLWGFTFRNVPLNGRVWYPAGDGPFPLVLMAHGNHDDGDFSDPGYAYLGELLASRGFIFVSVDENFLNGGFLGQPPTDMAARAYLLLKHLEQWQRWNTAAGNPFTGRVDWQQIALMGHSRGGEAAAVAALMNAEPLYRDNGSLAFDFHYPIKAVVALAPSEGLYRGGASLTNVNYLVLQGGRDTDSFAFFGLRQYRRVQLNDGGDWLKAAVWFDHVNHGQMNTTWVHDRSLPVRLWYAESSLMQGDEARQIVQTYIAAFLAATLQGRQEYRAFLANPAAGAGWLPETAYAARYQDAAFAVIADYDEDGDLQTTRLQGGSVSFTHLTVVERHLALRKGIDGETRVAELSWRAGAADPHYTLQWPGTLSLPAGSRLSFAVGNGTTAPVVATVAVADARGNRASLPLDRYVRLVPLPTHPVTRGGVLDQRQLKVGGYDAVLQTVTIPLADFQALNPAMGPVVTLTLQFDASTPGNVVLDDIGFEVGR